MSEPKGGVLSSSTHLIQPGIKHPGSHRDRKAHTLNEVRAFFILNAFEVEMSQSS